MSSVSEVEPPSLEVLNVLRQTLSGELGQSHLFEGWPPATDPSAYTLSQVSLLQELYDFKNKYEGGVEQYVRNGQRLLQNQSGPASTYLDLDVPTYAFRAPSLHPSPSNIKEREMLRELEREGTALLPSCAFVLVAGGLGERLGYPGIKIGLPVETTTGGVVPSTTVYPHNYLQHYCQWIQQVYHANQNGSSSSSPPRRAPLIIMTSKDTHQKTEELISEMKEKKLLHMDSPTNPLQIILLKQEQVFCFADSEAHLAVHKEINKEGQEVYSLPKKPHGHGDVHSLIYSAKFPGRDRSLLEVLESDYQTQYMVFFQDTNAIAPWTVPISLAYSKKHDLRLNLTCIEREEGEAVGVVCRAKSALDKEGRKTEWRTAPVEYNIYEELVKGKDGLPEDSRLRRLLDSSSSSPSDTPGTTPSYSPFPGNINTLLFEFSTYKQVLTNSKGTVPEFINPKYETTSDGRRVFKSPARIESLMQDLSALLDSREEGSDAVVRERVGVTVFDRSTYQPVKNNLKDVFKKVEKGEESYGATTGECRYYEFMRNRLAAVGVPIPPATSAASNLTLQSPFSPSGTATSEKGLEVNVFPNIVLDSVVQGDYTLEHLHQQVFPTPEAVNISAGSTLYIQGAVRLESVVLDGALCISGPPSFSESVLGVSGVEVHNKPWTVKAIPSECYNGKEEPPRYAPVDLMRGIRLKRET